MSAVVRKCLNAEKEVTKRKLKSQNSHDCNLQDALFQHVVANMQRMWHVIVHAPRHLACTVI